MAVSISTLSVKLTASAGAFSSTMAGAGKQLSSFGSSITSIGSKVLGFGGALTALAAGGSLAYMTKQSMEAIDANAKLSHRLGISTEALTGLQYAGDLAGASSEELTGGLEKMLKALGGTADDGELASNAFTKLKLSAAQLANLPADEAFAQIAQRLSDIPNAAERATAATQIFGKAGQSLLPLLLSGSEGIKAAQQEAQKLGLTYSRIDAAKVEAANDSITRMSKVWEGVSNQIAIGLSPYIDAAATKMMELTTTGGGIGPKVGGAIEFVAKSVAYLADYLSLVDAAWQVMRGTASYVLGSVLDGLGAVVGGLEWLIAKVTGVNEHFGDSMQGVAKAMLSVGDDAFKKAGQDWDTFQNKTNSKAVANAFIDIKAKADESAKKVAENAAKMQGSFKGLEDGAANLKKVSESLGNIQKDVDQFGLSDSQKKIADLKSNGATEGDLAKAQGLLALKEQLESINKISGDDPLTDFAAKMEKLQQLYAAGKLGAEQFGALRDTAKTTLNEKLSESAKSITADVQSPLEKYQAEVEKLNTLLDQKLITQETFDRASLKAKSSLESSGEKSQPAAVSAIRAGSAEAMKLAFESSRGVTMMTKDQVAQAQLKQQQNSNTFLEQIARNTKDATSGAALEEVDI